MVRIRIRGTAVTASHFRKNEAKSVVAAGDNPCYVDALEQPARKHAFPLSTTNWVLCHGVFSRLATWLAMVLLACSLPLAAQTPEKPQSPTPEQSPTPTEQQLVYEPPPLPKPDFKTRPPRPEAPNLGEYNFTADTQTKEGNVYHFRGKVVLEGTLMELRADEIDYNDETGDAEARGHVYFRHYERNEILVCARAKYNTESEYGTFWEVRGYAKTKIDAQPGTLTSDNPFYFEGKWAERVQEKYILHEGMITGCVLPNPWWTLTGPKFDIIPEDRALAYKAIYRVKKIPLFYFPVFYKSLAKEPRKSGFLSPNIGNSTRWGFLFGLGYYWAINRSYDVTYQVQDFTSRGFAHHIDFRGKPTQTSDFNAIFYGLQDRGIEVGNAIQKQGGYSIYATGHADLGNGWFARGTVNYLSSFRFRANFTESFNEAIFSESNSVGYVTKNFDSYTFNGVFSRNENFQDQTPGNYILIRKLPEAQFMSRDHRILRKRLPTYLPLWGFFDSSAGLMYRSEPTYTATGAIGSPVQTQQFTRRTTMDPGLVTAAHFLHIHLIPSFKLHEAYYSEQHLLSGILVSPYLRNAREASLDLVLPSVERVFKKKTWLGDQLKHVIEPRATYRYVSGVDNYEQVIRFDGSDLLTNTNELLLSLTNRIYTKRGDQISEIFTGNSHRNGTLIPRSEAWSLVNVMWS